MVANVAEGKQIKSSMLPAYCDPPNPCPLGYTAQVCFLFLKPFQFHPRLQFPNLTLRTAALRILKTTRNSHKSIRSAAFPQAADWQVTFRLLRTVCATLSICLLVRSRNSRYIIVNLHISGKKEEHKVSNSIQLCGIHSINLQRWKVKDWCQELWKGSILEAHFHHFHQLLDRTCRWYVCLFWLQANIPTIQPRDFHGCIYFCGCFTFFNFFDLTSFDVSLSLMASIWHHSWSEWGTLLPWWLPLCRGSQGLNWTCIVFPT